MKIEERKIAVSEMFDGYVDSAELGVKAYGGRLNVRPACQREFVYNPQQRDAVINTVRHGFPLNVMYWVRNGEGGYGKLDGFGVVHTAGEKLTAQERRNAILEKRIAQLLREDEDIGKTVAENCQMLCADCNRRKRDV